MGLKQESLLKYDKALIEIREGVIFDIVSGGAIQIYSEWLLEGTLREPFNPTFALTVFPNRDGNQDLHVLAMADNVGPAFDYWNKVALLGLPEKVREIEVVNYAQYRNIAIAGKILLENLSRDILVPKFPSAMIVFSKPLEGHPESAYLFAPTIIPPSIAFEQIKELAKQHLQTLN